MWACCHQDYEGHAAAGGTTDPNEVSVPPNAFLLRRASSWMRFSSQPHVRPP
jgi:hypothetical protein